jgi:hypothetical protein
MQQKNLKTISSSPHYDLFNHYRMLLAQTQNGAQSLWLDKHEKIKCPPHGNVTSSMHRTCTAPAISYKIILKLYNSWQKIPAWLVEFPIKQIPPKKTVRQVASILPYSIGTVVIYGYRGWTRALMLTQLWNGKYRFPMSCLLQPSGEKTQHPQCSLQ